METTAVTPLCWAVACRIAIDQRATRRSSSKIELSSDQEIDEAEAEVTRQHAVPVKIAAQFLQSVCRSLTYQHSARG